MAIGCFVMLGLGVLAGIGLYVTYRVVISKLEQAVQEYTDAAPRPIPIVNMPDEDRKKVTARANAFLERMKAVPTAEKPGILTEEERTLTLTADELNVLFENDPNLKGRFHVSIQEDQVTAEISIPLSELQIEMVRGRYLNGNAKVNAQLVDGVLQVHLRDIQVKGKPLPEWLNTPLEEADLLAGSNDSNHPQPPLTRKYESLTIKDGKVTVVARKEPDTLAPPVKQAEKE